MSPEVTRYILWNELATAMNYLRYELHQRCMNCLLCKHCGVSDGLNGASIARPIVGTDVPGGPFDYRVKS